MDRDEILKYADENEGVDPDDLDAWRGRMSDLLDALAYIINQSDSLYGEPIHIYRDTFPGIYMVLHQVSDYEEVSDDSTKTPTVGGVTPGGLVWSAFLADDIAVDEPTPELMSKLTWLAENDPNGEWRPYLVDYRAASAEFGEVDEDSLDEVIAEMTE